MPEMYGPLRYFTKEMLKNLGERTKEVMTFMYPPITMYEDAGEIVIEADLPGFDKKDIHVTLEKGALSIHAKRTVEKKGTVLMDQRPEEVSKRLHLPVEVDPDVTFTAKYTNGVLLIRIPAKGIKTIKVE